MELGDILTKDLPLSVMWMGEEFEFSYSPAGYSETLHAELGRVQLLPDESPEKVAVTVSILAAMMRSWTLTEKAVPVELAEHSIRRLPALMRGAMVAEIMSDMQVRKRVQGGPKSVLRLLPGSKAEAEGESGQSGTERFELPDDWDVLPGTTSDDPSLPVATTGDGGTA